MKMKHFGLVALFLIVAILNQPILVQAHTPGPITLDYDIESETLTVNVMHVVEDVNTHYIYEVVIEKNSVLFTTRNYTNQSSASGMSDIFVVPATNGDVLRATAKCIISGQASAQITVSDSSTTTTTTTTTTSSAWLLMEFIILGVVIALALVMVIMVFLKRR
jgi:hypothetical protein